VERFHHATSWGEEEDLVMMDRVQAFRYGLKAGNGISMVRAGWSDNREWKLSNREFLCVEGGSPSENPGAKGSVEKFVGVTYMCLVANWLVEPWNFSNLKPF